MNNADQRTILIIEDYTDSRELLGALLRRKGYNVVEAENGKEGLLQASRTNPDLILMDLAMPEMDGVEAIRRIRAVPKLADTPVFIISAYATSDVIEDARDAGGTTFFDKPLDVDALLRRIASTLGGAGEGQQGG